MLRIEKLFLQGFKSFCDPTEIVFDEEGITAVVGPNGCGKSNVADAISWVIGEQRAKALRGGKMEDVIFQGSRNRQPSGMAEVMLTMVVHESFEIRSDARQPETDALRQAEESLQQADEAIEASTAEPAEEPQPGLAPPEAEGIRVESESDGQNDAPPAVQQTPQPQQAKKRRRTHIEGAPLIFHEGERITVGRRLYRTGESEYEMNGRTCRLRDIQDLFAGTGLGGAHYAIIEQGRIGQVLSARPLDRRALIEEAAGISKFKMRQHSAELKLEASRQNLSRITDILAEIERQQNSLKRQAARARRYQRLRQEMRDLMRAVYVVDYRTTRGAIGEIEKVLSTVSAESAALMSRINELEQEQGLAAQNSREAEEALNEMRRIAAGLDVETERARQQHSHLNEQLQSLAARSAQFTRDQAVINERRQFIDREAARLREELSQIEQEINGESKTLTEAEDLHRLELEKVAGAETRLDEARKAVYETVTRLERWKQLNRQFTDSVDRGRARLDGLNSEKERARLQAQSAQDEFARLTASLNEITARQHSVGTEHGHINDRLSALRRARDDKQAIVSSTHRDLTATEHRLKSLAELDQRRAFFSDAVQALLTRDSQANGYKTLGTLSDYVQVSSEHEGMIETALREELQYVVVPTFDDALGAIEFLKNEGAGRATFLVVGLHGAESVGTASNGDGPQGNGHRTLDSLLGLRPEFAEAFRLALPGLATAAIVEDTSQAINDSVSTNGSSGNGHGYPHTTLSITGERVVAGRLISGGSNSEKALGVLAVKREIADLQALMQQLVVAARTNEAELAEIISLITGLEESQKRLDGELRQIDKQLAVMREQLQQCDRERERTAIHIRIVEQEIAQADEELREFEGKLEHATGQMTEAGAARNESQRIVETAQTEMAELRRLADERSQDLSRRRAEFAAKTERRRGLLNDIRRLESESGDLDERLDRARMEAVEAEGLTSTTQTNLQSTAELLQQLAARQTQRAAELEQRSDALTQARARLEALETEIRSARDAASQLREERAEKEIEKTRLTSNQEHLIHTCYNELGENIVEVCERLDQPIPDLPVSFTEITSEPETLDAEETEDYGHDTTFEISFWTVPEDFDLDAAKARLDELRQKIDALGPVNMMALEELTEVEERFHFLTAQKADIEKAIVDTQTAIADIKRRSRERFQEAFHAINENFKLMFVELFGGGHGEMRLIDETDLLESGIEIIAQPPGKRLQNVLLLSGGEKAMAALALVLSIFKYRPSPFCLLDEVDAPLDEVNIGRFSEKVIEMSSKTQFMIITHSKRTMESANTLYGVTMEDPGVSKLLSVKLTS